MNDTEVAEAIIQSDDYEAPIVAAAIQGILAGGHITDPRSCPSRSSVRSGSQVRV